MFITEALAQIGDQGGGSDFLISLLPFVLIFAIMWFLIIRPQQQRAKNHREMVSNVRRGDTIVTAGGIVAKVTKVHDDNEIQIEISDGVRIKLLKATISEVRTKGEPVKDSSS